MAYAYISKSENFHVADDKKTAVEYSINGKVVEFDGGHEGGYPTLANHGQLIIYTDTMMGYINGNKVNGIQVAIPADIAEVINRLK